MIASNCIRLVRLWTAIFDKICSQYGYGSLKSICEILPVIYGFLNDFSWPRNGSIVGAILFTGVITRGRFVAPRRRHNHVFVDIADTVRHGKWRCVQLNWTVR